MSAGRGGIARWQAWLERVNLWAATLSGWLVLAVTVITCYGVFMRYGMNAPETWSFPVSAYLLSFIVFLAVSHALQQRVHVRVDLLYEWFPARVTRWIGLLADLLSLCFLWLVVLKTWQVFHASWSSGRTDETTLGWPLALVQWVMPLSAALLFLTQLMAVWVRFAGGAPDGAGARETAPGDERMAP
jgi:TRAP-type C4-dicarboxylate transport system permease small subunit